MIYSMTGFGKASGLVGGRKVTIEVKSLNSKQLDLSVRLPSDYRYLEASLRGEVSRRLLRGKAELTGSVEWADADTTRLNVDRMGQYKRAIEKASQELGIAPPADWWGTLLRLPEVLDTPQYEASDAELEAVLAIAGDALDGLVAFRAQEGRRLEAFFEQSVAAIGQLLDEVPPLEAGRVEKIRARITEGLEKLGTAYDTNRLEQELIYYIEKLDITEEKVRLRTHLTYFLETLHGEAGQGKKLGFIAQEMGREINTLGSKANQAEMQTLVVKMKDHLEQIKEQVLNVL